MRGDGDAVRGEGGVAGERRLVGERQLSTIGCTHCFH